MFVYVVASQRHLTVGLFKKNDTDLYIFEKQNDWKIPIFIDSSYLRLCQPNTPFKKKITLQLICDQYLPMKSFYMSNLK